MLEMIYMIILLHTKATMVWRKLHVAINVWLQLPISHNFKTKSENPGSTRPSRLWADLAFVDWPQYIVGLDVCVAKVKE